MAEPLRFIRSVQPFVDSKRLAQSKAVLCPRTDCQFCERRRRRLGL